MNDHKMPSSIESPETFNTGRSRRLERPESMNDKPVIYRKVLLRVVFWALGLAACFGAAGVLFAGHDTLWRIVGTCAVTAAGAFLMLAASRQLDREATWLPGVMVIALIVIEYLAALGLIWDLFRSAEEQAGLTMFFLAATTIPAIGFLGILKRADGALSARVGLVASVVIFALLMVGTWGGWLGAVRADRWQLLGLSLAIFAVLAVLCLIGTGTDRRHWRWLGVAAAGTAFSISAYAILLDIHETSAFFVCVVSVAVIVAHANSLVRCPLKPAQRRLLWGTIGAAIATAGFVNLAKIMTPWQEEMLGRLAGATAIIAGCGTLALLILARINQRLVPTAAAASELREITLRCPRCRARQTIAIGSGKCGACGLIIEVRVQPVALVQSLAIILAALAATAQATPDAGATNAAVSTEEVTTFMQSPNGVFDGLPDPKRVPLLPGSFFEELAIEFQLTRDCPWPECFGTFDALVRFIAEHAHHAP